MTLSMVKPAVPLAETPQYEIAVCTPMAPRGRAEERAGSARDQTALRLPSLPQAVLCLLVFLLVLTPARAQMTNATCERSPTTEWAFNANGESPCLAWAKLQSLCLSEHRYINVPPLLDASWGYNPPIAGNVCQCNVAAYSLMAACSWCQLGEVNTWATQEEWSARCVEYNNTSISFAQSALALPAYAFLPLGPSDRWSPSSASAAAAAGSAATLAPTAASVTLTRSFGTISATPTPTLPTAESSIHSPSRSPPSLSSSRSTASSISTPGADSDSDSEDDTPDSTSTALPLWVPILLGTVGGLILVILLLLILRDWRRRARLDEERAGPGVGVSAGAGAGMGPGSSNMHARGPLTNEPGISLPHRTIRGTSSAYFPGGSPVDFNKEGEGAPVVPTKTKSGGMALPAGTSIKRSNRNSTASSSSTSSDSGGSTDSTDVRGPHGTTMSASKVKSKTKAKTKTKTKWNPLGFGGISRPTPAFMGVLRTGGAGGGERDPRAVKRDTARSGWSQTFLHPRKAPAPGSARGRARRRGAERESEMESIDLGSSDESDNEDGTGTAGERDQARADAAFASRWRGRRRDDAGMASSEEDEEGDSIDIALGAVVFPLAAPHMAGTGNPYAGMSTPTPCPTAGSDPSRWRGSAHISPDAVGAQSAYMSPGGTWRAGQVSRAASLISPRTRMDGYIHPYAHPTSPTPGKMRFPRSPQPSGPPTCADAGAGASASAAQGRARLTVRNGVSGDSGIGGDSVGVGVGVGAPFSQSAANAGRTTDRPASPHVTSATIRAGAFRRDPHQFPGQTTPAAVSTGVVANGQAGEADRMGGMGAEGGVSRWSADSSAAGHGGKGRGKRRGDKVMDKKDKQVSKGKSKSKSKGRDKGKSAELEQEAAAAAAAGEGPRLVNKLTKSKIRIRKGDKGADDVPVARRLAPASALTPGHSPVPVPAPAPAPAPVLDSPTSVYTHRTTLPHPAVLPDLVHHPLPLPPPGPPATRVAAAAVVGARTSFASGPSGSGGGNRYSVGVGVGGARTRTPPLRPRRSVNPAPASALAQHSMRSLSPGRDPAHEPVAARAPAPAPGPMSIDFSLPPASPRNCALVPAPAPESPSAQAGGGQNDHLHPHPHPHPRPRPHTPGWSWSTAHMHGPDDSHEHEHGHGHGHGHGRRATMHSMYPSRGIGVGAALPTPRYSYAPAAPAAPAPAPIRRAQLHSALTISGVWEPAMHARSPESGTGAGGGAAETSKQLDFTRSPLPHMDTSNEIGPESARYPDTDTGADPNAGIGWGGGGPSREFSDRPNRAVSTIPTPAPTLPSLYEPRAGAPRWEHGRDREEYWDEQEVESPVPVLPGGYVVMPTPIPTPGRGWGRGRGR